MSVRDRDDLVVARLQQLAPHLDGEPDPAWQAKTRARLVAMAAVRSPEPEPVSPLKRLFARTGEAAPSRWRGRLTAGLAGAAMAVTACATLVAVATDAGPGDPLYGLKRGTEQTQLALAGDGRGQTLLELARTRLHELEELTGSEVSALPVAAGTDGITVLAADADPALVLETLATMDAQTTEGAAWLADQAVESGDDAPVDLLAEWTDEQTAGLAALRGAVPSSTVDELDGSLARLGQIATRTVALSDVLDCASGVPVEANDQFGPVPGLCLPDSTPPAAGGPTDPNAPVEPGQGSESTGTAAVPSSGVPGAGSGGPQQGGQGPAVPSADVPGDGTSPSVPVPSLPTLPLPTSGLPGSATGSGPTTNPSSSPSSPIEIEICLGPIVLGNCSD